MSIIADIRVYRGVYTISTDDGQSLRIRVKDFKANPVKTGDSVDFEAYGDHLSALQFPQAYEAALSMLDCSAKTRRELSRSLHLKGYVPNCVEAVLDRLEECRLLDDAAVAQRYAENASNGTVGIYALRQKLRAKGISEEDMSEALDSLDDDQQIAAAKKVAQKLYRKYEDLPPREGRGKLSQALARRGFSWDTVRAATEDLFCDDFDD